MRRSLILLSLAACGEVSVAGGNVPPPTISALDPGAGPVAGGTTITVTGAGFADHDAGETHVIVGGTEAKMVDVVDDTSLTFVLPAAAATAAAVDVYVFNGNGVAVAKQAFTYAPLPTVSAIDPDFDKLPGGRTITIHGTGFQDLAAGAVSVAIGAAAAVTATVTDDHTLTAKVPALAGAMPFDPLDVVVTTQNGSATLAGAFRYTKPGLLATTNGRFAATGVYFFDLERKEVRLLAPLGQGVDAMAVNPAGKVEIVSKCCPNAIGLLDPMHGRIAFGGLIRDAAGNPDRIHDMTYVGGQRIGFVSGARRYVTLADDGVYTFAGTENFLGPTGAWAITRRDATSFFLVHALDEPIRTVPVSTFTAAVGATLQGPAGIFAHGLALVDGTLYAATRGQLSDSDPNKSDLVTITPLTGAVTFFMTIPPGTAAISATPPGF